MKRTFVGTALLAAIFSMAALAQGAATPAASTPSTSTAVPPGGAKVGIIEVQQVIAATNEGTRDLEALQKKFDPKRTELQNLNTEIEQLQKQLQTQGDKMNEDARNNLVKSIEAKKKTLQRSGEDAQADYQQQVNEVLNRLMQKMGPVIDKYAKDNGFSLIIDSSNPQTGLIWAAPSVDISKAIVDLYNAQSGVPAPAAGAAKPAASTGSGMRPGAGTTTPPPAKPATTTTQTTPKSQ
jgi:outer membrane protein